MQDPKRGTPETATHQAPPRRRRRALVASAVGASLVLVAVVLVWFSPQSALVKRTVREALPTSPATEKTPGTTAPSTTAPTTTVPPGPTVLGSGSFRSVDHETTGRVSLLRLPDGSRFVRIEGLSTTNGPDLRVVLTVDPTGEETSSSYLDLGALKGNVGDQNYAVPADVDPALLRGVAVWCRRFDATFGVAALEA